MKKPPIFVVECGNDEQLLLLLNVPRARIQHEGNRDEVVKYVLHHEPGAYIGVIDEDPGTTHNEARKKFERTGQDTGLHTEAFGQRKLVVLHPLLEGFLIAAAKGVGSNIAALDKGLSDSPSELHRRLQSKGDPRLKKIVDHLVAKKSKHITALRAALGIR